MGFFTSEKILHTQEEIKKALFKIQTLDYQQRPIVFEALRKELDDGGVTTEELKRVVRELRRQAIISEIDKENLLQLTLGK